MQPRSAAAAAVSRKKGACVRTWLVVDSDGQSQAVEAGKYDIMRRTGLPARDLRILDPVLSYPSTVLGRERAIVVNLEYIKAIITAQEVLLLNSKDPLVTPFLQKLQSAVLNRQTAFKSPQEATDGGVSNNSEDAQRLGQQAAENAQGLKLLPFEFVALEVCLKAACSTLDHEARALEQETYPALDKLTSNICTLNLERVRQIKSRLVAITGRVQKVRDEVEHLLDDDKDMAELYLSEKLEQTEFDDSSVSSLSELNDLTEEEVVLPSEENGASAKILSRQEDSSILSLMGIEQSEIVSDPNFLKRDSHRTTSTTHNTITKQFDVAELEMILEAYFVQIEGTMNKLATLREYVDDTEDYINIMLDDKQNQLLQMGVLIATATVVVSAFLAMTGLFGMNIGIDLFNSDTPEEMQVGMIRFLWTVGGGSIGCVVMYAFALAFYKYKKLL